MSSDDFIQRTLETWQPYYDYPLTVEDAQEIVTNWNAFINFVAEVLGFPEPESGYDNSAG